MQSLSPRSGDAFLLRAALAMCVAQWPAQAARADRLRASELELA